MEKENQQDNWLSRSPGKSAVKMECAHIEHRLTVLFSFSNFHDKQLYFYQFIAMAMFITFEYVFIYL